MTRLRLMTTATSSCHCSISILIFRVNFNETSELQRRVPVVRDNQVWLTGFHRSRNGDADRDLIDTDGNALRLAFAVPIIGETETTSDRWWWGWCYRRSTAAFDYSSTASQSMSLDGGMSDYSSTKSQSMSFGGEMSDYSIDGITMMSLGDGMPDYSLYGVAIGVSWWRDDELQVHSLEDVAIGGEHLRLVLCRGAGVPLWEEEDHIYV